MRTAPLQAWLTFTLGVQWSFTETSRVQTCPLACSKQGDAGYSAIPAHTHFLPSLDQLRFYVSKVQAIRLLSSAAYLPLAEGAQGASAHTRMDLGGEASAGQTVSCGFWLGFLSVVVFVWSSQGGLAPCVVHNGVCFRMFSPVCSSSAFRRLEDDVGNLNTLNPRPQELRRQFTYTPNHNKMHVARNPTR